MEKRENKRLKTNIQSILVIAVVLIVLSFFGGCRINLRSTYKNANKYTAGDFEYKASGVSRVEINWIDGNITIRQSGKDVLAVEENGKDLKNPQKLHWYLDGDTLMIQYCKSGYNGRIPSSSKDLTIEVPEGIELKINSVSSGIRVDEDQEYENLEINTVSGTADIQIEKCEKISVNTVSGKLELKIADCDKVEIDSVSADVVFGSLPQEGAVLEYSSVSGSLKTDCPFEQNGKKYVFGKGNCAIHVHTVSGNVQITE